MLRPGQFPASTVERVARAVLREPSAVVGNVSVRPLDYDAYLPGRFVHRVSGTAVVRGAKREWSAIVKWTDSPSVTPNSPCEGGSREADALRSGLLHDVRGLRAPRLYEATGSDGQSICLWLEDLGALGPPWSVDDFATAARAIGRFNASFIGRTVPPAPWLVTNWADRQSEPVNLAAELEVIDRAARSPAAIDALGAELAHHAKRMIERQPEFKAALASLPQTLCHHDAAKSNLFVLGDVRASEVVAIDWELVGTGPIGADIATLISGSLRKGDFPAERAAELDATVLSAYVDGLRTERWSGNDSAARLGLSASLALRYWFIRDTLAKLADQETQAADREILISRYLLDRSEEALALIG